MWFFVCLLVYFQISYTRYHKRKIFSIDLVQKEREISWGVWRGGNKMNSASTQIAVAPSTQTASPTSPSPSSGQISQKDFLEEPLPRQNSLGGSGSNRHRVSIILHSFVIFGHDCCFRDRWNYRRKKEISSEG